MIIVVVLALIAAAAASLGLRTTDGLLGRVTHPGDRLALALVVGLVWVALALRLSSEFGVFEAGLGLIISLAPVGAFDVARWWYRSRHHLSPWLLGPIGPSWLVVLRWLFVAGVVVVSLSAFIAVASPPAAPL